MKKFGKIIVTIAFAALLAGGVVGCSETEEVASTTPVPAIEEEPVIAATTGEQNALDKAGDYLDFIEFSYSGLHSQLMFEGFTEEEATFAVDNCGADWYEQAAGKAESYLEFMSFSREGLIDQLMFEGFTLEQAEYGVTAVGY